MNKPNRTQLLSLALIILLIGAGIGVYFWQHNKVDKANQQILVLTSTSNTLRNRNDTLTKQLNQANLDIGKLTQTNNFVSGTPCQTQQLALSEETGLPGASGGFRGELFSYQNTSQSTCKLNGYPGFLVLDSTGHVVPNGPISTNGFPTFKTSTVSFSLSPNSKAYFGVTWNDPRGFYSTVPPQYYCVTSALIMSTPPGNTIPLITSVSGPDICNDNLAISSLLPSTSTFGLPNH
jgi:hypothetical protein